MKDHTDPRAPTPRFSLETVILKYLTCLLSLISLTTFATGRTVSVEGIGISIRYTDKTYRYKSDHLDTADWTSGLIFPDSVPTEVDNMEFATHDFRPASDDSRTNDSINRVKADASGDLIIAMPSSAASGNSWTRLNGGSGPDFYLDTATRTGPTFTSDTNSPYWFYTRSYTTLGTWVSLPTNSITTSLPPFVFAEKEELIWANPPTLGANASIITSKPSGGSTTTTANPKMLVLSNGDYLASIRGSEEAGNTSLFKSTDRGESWTYLGGNFLINRDSLFEHNGDIYMIGWNTSGSAETRIYKSTDGGQNWTTQTFTGIGGGDAPSHVLVSQGRIWKAADPSAGPGFYSAPVSSDLMQESNWTLSVPGSGPDETLANGEQFRKKSGEPEGSLFLMEDGTPVNAFKSEVYRPGFGWNDGIAMIQGDATSPTLTTHDSDFAGPLLTNTNAKYTVLFDSVSDRYWALTSGGSNRGKLNLYSASSDNGSIGDFVLEQTVLEGHSTGYHGFNYPFIQFDGDDIVFALRTAWDYDRGTSDRWHNADLFTSHRIKDFRKTSTRVGGFSLSQNFDAEGEGLPFSTNLLTSDMTSVTSHNFGFTNAVFAGDGFNDYATIYPEYSDTLSSTNGELEIKSQFGNNFVIVEDTQDNDNNLPDNPGGDSLILSFPPST